MIIYFLLVFSIFVIKIMFSGPNQLSSRQNELFSYVGWFLLLSIVAGLRGESIGTDTGSYKSLFLIINGLKPGWAGQEFLFRILNLFIGIFTDNPQWFIITSSAITTIGVLIFIRHNSKFPTLSVFLYIALYYYFFSMNGVRQFLAISLILISIEYALSRKIFPYIFWMGLAIGFHTSAILGFVFWFLSGKSLRRMRVFQLALMLIIIMVGFDYLAPIIANYLPRYTGFLSSTTESSMKKMEPLVYIIIFLGASIVAIFDKKWRANPRNAMLFYGIEIAAVWSLATFIIRNLDSNIYGRIGWFFQIIAIALVPNLLDSTLLKENKTFFYVLFVLLGLLFMLYFLSVGYHRVVPYRFYFM